MKPIIPRLPADTEVESTHSDFAPVGTRRKVNREEARLLVDHLKLARYVTAHRAPEAERAPPETPALEGETKRDGRYRRRDMRAEK